MLKGRSRQRKILKQYIKKWMPLLTIEVCLREAPAMIFDWEHFVVFDRLASIAYSLDDGLLQGVTAP